MFTEAYNKLVNAIQTLIKSISTANKSDCKRTNNYLEWTAIKTEIVNSEDTFSLSPEKAEPS